MAWSISERDFDVAPFLVGTGTLIVQTHVGLVVGVALVGALMMAWRPRRADDPTDTSMRGLATLRRPAIITAVVAAVLWMPPLIEQVTREPGNLSSLAAFTRRPSTTR